MNGKQGKIGIQETKSSGDWFPSSNLTVIFPPVNVIQVLPKGVYAVLPLMSPLEVFCTYSHSISLHGPRWGPHQTLNRTNNISALYISNVASPYASSNIAIYYIGQIFIQVSKSNLYVTSKILSRILNGPSIIQSNFLLSR